MSMAVEHKPQSHFGGMGYDSMRYPQQPHFTNPWASNSSSSPTSQHPMYASSMQPPQSLEHQQPRSQSMSMGYTANPAASSLGSELVPARSYGSSYTSSAPQSQPAYAPSVPQYSSPEQPSHSPYTYDQSRRPSYPQHSSPATFSDEMASARGMVAMANSQDMTPRNIYGSNARSGSQDGYGFPAAHSNHSSISSASTYPYYSGSYNGSVDGSSATDYSSASEDAMGPRTLPAPTQMINGVPGFPPEPASMMTQFNSKSSPNAQKKHKCKICDKRFTRPSSLQTHMYSHTGEKPFACDHEGCGRHFSVVSNLRRHKKVHKEDGDTSMMDDEE